MYFFVFLSSNLKYKKMIEDQNKKKQITRLKNLQTFLCKEYLGKEVEILGTKGTLLVGGFFSDIEKTFFVVRTNQGIKKIPIIGTKVINIIEVKKE